MRFENQGTNEIAFDSYCAPKEINLETFVWSQNTNLAEKLDYHVYFVGYELDPEKYAVVVDIGDDVMWWDGSLVNKKDIIITKEEEV